MADIFTYLDYRKFLKDSFDEIKNSRPTFSHRAFAKTAGFSSSNFVLLVMQGKRNLSGEAAIKIAKALKLKKKETEFFENLVRFNQSKTDAEKNFYYSRIAATRQYAAARPLERSQYEYYSKWFIPVVREMVLLADFSEDPQWISQNIKPSITPTEAAEAIAVLEKLGLLSRDIDGKLVQSERHVTTGDEVESLAVTNFQREMITLAGKSIDETPPKSREISSVTFAVSKERFDEAKKMIQDFRSKVAGFLAEEQKASEVLYQFNVQLFNVSRLTKTGKACMPAGRRKENDSE